MSYAQVKKLSKPAGCKWRPGCDSVNQELDFEKFENTTYEHMQKVSCWILLHAGHFVRGFGSIRPGGSRDTAGANGSRPFSPAGGRESRRGGGQHQHGWQQFACDGRAECRQKPDSCHGRRMESHRAYSAIGSGRAPDGKLCPGWSAGQCGLCRHERRAGWPRWRIWKRRAGRRTRPRRPGWWIWPRRTRQ